METQERNIFDAFVIIEKQDAKAEWIKIGVAFKNRDDSINLFLDAFPKDGKLQLRLRKKSVNIK